MMNKYVEVKTILFKGKQNIDWKAVRTYMNQYVGKEYKTIETEDKIRLNYDFIQEFTGSEYTVKMRGSVAKAKANIAQIIPELIKSATNRR